jgi:hypothetical protein
LHVGAFFNKRARDTSHAKASLGGFPPIFFAPRNKKLKLAVDFSIASRLYFHSAIYKCFDDFNRTNGAVVTLQSGLKMNMAKAIILAIFCDHPAARKCCLCGSSCPQCFASQPDFAKTPIGGTMLMRTPGNIEVKKKVSIYIRLDVCIDVSFNVRVNVPFDVRLKVSLDVGHDLFLDVCIDVCLDVCINVSFDVRLDVCIDVCLDVCINVSFDVRLDVCLYVCLDVGP